MSKLLVLTTTMALIALNGLSMAYAGGEIARGGDGREGGGRERQNMNHGNYNHGEYHNQNYMNHPGAVGYGTGERRGYEQGYGDATLQNEQYGGSGVYYDPNQQYINQEYYQETQSYQSQPNYNGN